MDYREIIRLIKAGEKSGIEALYQEYAAKLYDYAVYKWQFTEDEAWEMVYKTMYTLLLKLPAYPVESENHLTNLIFVFFKNNLKQYYRDKKSKQENPVFVSVEQLEGEPDLRFSVGDTVFEDYYQNEILDSPLVMALKNALEKLSPEDKDLLLLKAQNYTYDEIAAMLGIENNQLKVKHHRAKKKLIDLIANQQTLTNA